MSALGLPLDSNRSTVKPGPTKSTTKPSARCRSPGRSAVDGTASSSDATARNRSVSTPPSSPGPGRALGREVLEEGSDVAAERAGLLDGREVTAAGHGRPPADVVEPLGPLAGGRAVVDELVREDGHRGRHRDRVG